MERAKHNAATAPPTAGPDDRALVEQARRGAVAAFGQLVERWQGPLYNFLLQLARSGEDAADLTQESFLRAWQRLDRYDDRWCFSTWLFAIARRLWLDQHRARRRRLHPLGGRAVASAVRSEDRSDTVETIDEAGRIWALAERVLSPEQRGALWLRYAFDRPLDEVARVYGRSSLATRVMLFRARQRLLAERERSTRTVAGVTPARPIDTAALTEMA
ncbi:MAG: RNA polymerase sigma factor [Planctomycetota bacterium]|jgi:RNA polymerase sigma-70 factor (ECF subfamily)